MPNSSTYQKCFFLLLFLSASLSTYSQQVTYLGDSIFRNNSEKDTLDVESFYTEVEIGRLFSKSKKHGLIFQQIDSINYINELKLITFHKGKPKEELIETFEIGMLLEFKRLDMNQDGFFDLVITQGSQRAWSRLYLFDPSKQTLIKIPDFKNYRAVEQLANSPYFYSYTALGCADHAWESKLFRIEGVQIIDYGVINGRGCSQQSTERFIEITHGDIKKTLPFDETLPRHGDKWSFIKHYWEQVILNR